MNATKYVSSWQDKTGRWLAQTLATEREYIDATMPLRRGGCSEHNADPCFHSSDRRYLCRACLGPIEIGIGNGSNECCSESCMRRFEESTSLPQDTESEGSGT